MSEATSGAGSAVGKADPGLRFAYPGYGVKDIKKSLYVCCGRQVALI
jgi:hypothetical protein